MGRMDYVRPMASSFALASLIGRIPWFLVAITAVVLAISRWQRHPTVSMLVTVGVVIQVLTSLSFAVTTPMLASGGNHNMVGLVSAGIGLVSTIGYGCIVAAVFVGRSTGAEPPQQRW